MELAALIERMLARDPERRPRDGAVVRAALAAVAALHMDQEDTSAQPSSALRLSLTRDEQHLLSVVLIGPPPVHGADGADGAMDPRVSAGFEPTELTSLRRAAEAHGGYLEVRVDGSVLVAISSTQLATDQAALAARCALALRAEAPDRLVVLAIGRGDGSTRAPGRDIVDRAAGKLARRLRSVTGDHRCGDGNEGPSPIWIDDVTTGLLDRRFDVREGEAGFELHGERMIPGMRQLLGRPTSCVGRDRELASLARLFDGCVRESTAHAVLVTSPAGMGKSRFAAELMTRIEERHDRAVFWVARGDSLRGGSAFGLLRQALQRALGLRDSAPLAARQDALRARVAQHVPEADRRRVTDR